MSDQSQTAQQPFVELSRRFRKLDQTAKAEETALDSYTVGLFWPDKNLSWDDLLNESRVVVLGEPGSGKTWELRERVRLLADRGEFAFFIRLDQLVGRELKTLLNAEDQRRFIQWKQNTAQAHFFLDSVDEAKFHKVSDFYATLERFVNEIGADSLGRAKIFLSSRISEWKPASDAFEFRRLFPMPPTMIVSLIVSVVNIIVTVVSMTVSVVKVSLTVVSVTVSVVKMAFWTLSEALLAGKFAPKTW